MSLAILENEEASHVGQFALRRWRLGEMSKEDGDGILAHLNTCAKCRLKIRSLEEEDHQFQATISFEQFAGGVERARRVPRAKAVRPWQLAALGSFATAAVILLFLIPGSMKGNRIKGDTTAATVRIAGAGTQRTVEPDALEVLRPGERLRLGVRTLAPAFLLVLAIDANGVITPIYPESGSGLKVSPSRDMQYLPDSMELTGQGQERIFLFLTPSAIPQETARSALALAFEQNHKKLINFPPVAFPNLIEVKSYSWLFAKP